MSFLNAIKPLLKGSTEIVVRLSAGPDGIQQIAVTPKLDGMDAETTDVELANLQSLLAMPFVVNCPAEQDADAYFEAAVTAYQADRVPVLSDLEAHRARIAAAAAAAAVRKVEAEKAKADKAKGLKSPKVELAKPTPPAAPDLFAVAASAGTADAASSTTDSATADSSEQVADTDTSTTDSSAEDAA